ncbi:Growth hormone-releasing hormone receptor [Nymphon striatum]|nr:Growth hormone-releasing hormone receptor [Nymphon striatum]KAG1678350.1 Growth hormone-releasing hormone receptor [Nymphon striatum]KAG1678351.1 Growth hormone-releasing hormone receptor [Nymphon striatum]
MVERSDVQNQINILKSKYELCVKNSNNSSSVGKTCNASWNGYMCWPATYAGQQAQVTCPLYVKQFNNGKGVLKRLCLNNGSWLNETEDIFKTCYIETRTPLEVRERLRCPRNNLHLNLFTSFIIKSILCLFKEFLFTDGSLGFIWTVTPKHLQGQPVNMGLQVVHQPVALFSYSKLLLDTNGRTLPPQSHIPRVLQ